MKTVIPLYSNSSGLLPKGTRLNGIFEIEKLIGEGGMGQVYRAQALDAQEIVAVKVIKAEIARDQSLIGLLKKEASTLSRISHEAIVKYFIFSVDPEIKRPYLAMEYVEGPSLSDLIKDGPLSVDAVLVLLNRVGSGLDAAHRIGITHRDISPDNIILPRSDPGRAKLIDFGIARDHYGNETIIAERFAGKFNFASPEHLGLNTGKVTPKSDTYSFGLTLAAALIGAPLDLGGTQVEMLRCRQTVPDLSKIDPRMRKILAQMLQPEPADRPDTIADLTANRETGSVVLPKPADVARGSNWRQAALVASGIALVGAGSAGWYGVSQSFGPVDPSSPSSADPSRPGSRRASEAARAVEAAPQQNARIAEPPAQAPTPVEEPQARGNSQWEAAHPAPPALPPRIESRVPTAQVDPGSGAKQAELPPLVQGRAVPASTTPVAENTVDQAVNAKLDCSACPSLVEVPSGVFSMGSAADPSERPTHLVRIRAFLMSRGPITVAEWNACQTAGGCEARAEGAPDQPAANLSWDDAQQYVRWLSSTSRKGYRLPSEAEWEYAARGGTHTRFWWGDHFRSEMAPCRSLGSPPLDTAPKATAFPENPFGLTGTTCFVAQWVSDCWHKNYRGAPSDGSSWNAPNCKQRVLRGGTWRSRAEAEHVTSRDFYDLTVRYPGNGIRVARDF
ncbi:SUMF1/EgtB/PvdO family nonheme iron enzyme [Methylobacterium mesophilicum]